jgi:RNA polymerase sigma-70 factor (ECF subfamily)
VDARRQRERWKGRLVATADILPLIDSGPLPDEVLASQQRLQQLRGGLEALSARTREVLLLSRIEGLSHAQIAQRLGITVSAVEKHIAKAALFLTEWMDRP